MKNVTLDVKGSVVTITIDTAREFGKSSSGKSTIIASTEGNVYIPGVPGEVKLGINCYKQG